MGLLAGFFLFREQQVGEPLRLFLTSLGLRQGQVISPQRALVSQARYLAPPSPTTANGAQ